MIGSPFIVKRYYWATALILAMTPSLGLAAEGSSLQLIESNEIPILRPAEPAGTAMIRSSANSGVKMFDSQSTESGIRLIIPTNWSSDEVPTTKQGEAVISDGSQVAARVHNAQSIAVEVPRAEAEEIGLMGAAPDRPLKTIQFLSALSSNWGTRSTTPSPFKEETVRPAPEPKTEPKAEPVTPTPTQPAQPEPVQKGPVTEPPKSEPTTKALPPAQEAKPQPLPQPRRRPAPIESGPAPIVSPEAEVQTQPGGTLDDDLPYYDSESSCGTAKAGPCRIPQEQIRRRIFRGNTRMNALPYQEPSCANGQCPTGDPWGPGHWVGPGIWMPDQAAQMPPQMREGPVYYDDLPGGAGTYGWGPPRRFFTPRFLEERGITLGGWIDQGYTYNASNPADRYNGPVTFNDRSDDYQMNQLDVFLEREVDGSDSGLEIGGRVDVLFGTDARFTEAVGWETNWDMNERFYRLSIPQMYAAFGWRDWTVQMGHYYTTIGYESVPAVNNFFYSHSYSMQYGEPFTHTGMQAFRKINSQLKVNIGFNRGWDQFNGIYDCNRLSVLTGANWVSQNGRLKFDFALTAGPQAPDNSTVMYSMVGTYLPCGWLEYVVQHDYGQSTGGNLYNVRFAEWYSLNQYVFITLNEKWKIGTRIECFCDKQGVRVHGLGQGNLATGPYPGDFWEMTLGLNWEPRRNIRIRPEARWDWYSATGPTVNKPFDSGDSNQQFLLGVDAIVQF